MEKVRDKMEITVSLWKTFVFMLLCGFFTLVAWSFDLKYRLRFRKMCKYKTYSTEKLKAMLYDFNKLVTCEDPYVENFYEKHPELSKLNALWVFTLSWKKKVMKELERRGEDVA